VSGLLEQYHPQVISQMEILTNDQVKERLETALRKLYVRDSYLLEHDAHERSITHKLGEYLQQLFPDYDVDCEYNLDRHGSRFRKQWVASKLVGEMIKQFDAIRKRIKPSPKSSSAESLVKSLEENIEIVSKNFYPDIIVHKRGSNKFNILVIEAKKGHVIDALDGAKLAALTGPVVGVNHYQYQLGARINFSVGDGVVRNHYQPPLYYVHGAEE